MNDQELQDYKEELEEMLEQGYSVKKIAEFCNVSTPTIYSDFRKLGITPPNSKKYTKKADVQIAKMVEQNKTVAQIMRKTGKSKENVYYRLRKMGLAPPKVKFGIVATEERVMALVKFLEHTRTWEELIEEFDVSESTIYRDLERIKEWNLGEVVISLK